MHKWHVNSALGRGRPLSDITKVTDSIALSLRQFHISALQAQDEETSSSEPSTYRPKRKRLQNTTQEIQNLYARSAARSRPAPPSPASNVEFRSVKLDPSAAPGPGFAVDARSLGSRPSGAPRPFGSAPALRGPRQGGTSFRGDRGGGRGGRRARGDRGGRDRERGDGRQGRRRGNDEEAESREEDEVELTEAEEEYLRERERKNYEVAVPYQVEDLSRESLLGVGPAVAVGEFGMSELVEEKLRLVARSSMMEGRAGREEAVRRVLAGGLVRFETEEEKEEALAEAEKISKEVAELKSERKGELVEPEAIEFVGLEEEERQAVMESLLKGEYAIEGEGAGDGVMGHLMRSTSRNETYLSKDKSALLEKVRTLLPAQKSREAVKAPAVD